MVTDGVGQISKATLQKPWRSWSEEAAAAAFAHYRLRAPTSRTEVRNCRRFSPS